MLDTTASAVSTEFPLVSSAATTTAVANLPVVGDKLPPVLPPWEDDDFDVGEYYAYTDDTDVDDDEDTTTPTESSSSKMTWVN